VPSGLLSSVENAKSDGLWIDQRFSGFRSCSEKREGAQVVTEKAHRSATDMPSVISYGQPSSPRYGCAARRLVLVTANRAKAQYEEALARFQRAAIAANNLAWLDLDEGRLDDALRWATVAHEEMPRHVGSPLGTAARRGLDLTSQSNR